MADDTTFPELALQESPFPELDLPEARKARQLAAQDAFWREVHAAEAVPIGALLKNIMPKPPLRVVEREQPSILREDVHHELKEARKVRARKMARRALLRA